MDAQLKVGRSRSEVTVNTDVPLLNTVSGDQTSTMEASSMAELPQVGTANNSGNSWENFIVLLPGTSGTAGGAQGSASPGQEASSNGNMPFTNVLADGATSTLPASQNANPAVFDDLAEVQVSLSSFSAQYGVGGMIINQITKGGTDKFHGTAYEYVDNDGFNAAPFGFGANQQSRKQVIPFLRYNDYGGTIGGPIPVGTFKKKAFFFFGYDRIDNNGSSSRLPDRADRRHHGGRLYRQLHPLRSHHADDRDRLARQSVPGPQVVPVGIWLKRDSCGHVRQCLVKVLQQYYPGGTSNPGSSNNVGKFIQSNEQSPTLLASGVYQNNWHDSYPTPRPWRRFFGRLDYDITPNNRITLSDNQGDELENGANPVTPCPFTCQLGDVDNNVGQVTDVWNISSKHHQRSAHGLHRPVELLL